MSMMKLVCLGLAGAAGTLARFWISEGLKKTFVSTMPWGTWAVNITGCLLFGLVWALAEERNMVSSEFRFFALAGFMGAFTTFSTYIFETVDLVRDGSMVYAAVNIIGQNLAGLLAVLAGMAIARVLG